MNQRTGTAATSSIIAAIGSYLLTFTGHPVWGLLSGVVSLPLGVIGMVMAASPRVSGGIMSISAIVMGALAVIVSLLGVIGVIVF